MILVSACLAGENCRYDGNNNYNEEIYKLVQNGEAILVCPEVMGELSVPRNPVEIKRKSDGSFTVEDKDGNDYTEQFIKGAEECLKIAKQNNINTAILKSRSPSCGFGTIYDGTFSKNLIDGSGVTAELLSRNGLCIYNEKNFICAVPTPNSQKINYT